MYEYRIREDIELAQELLDYSREELACDCGRSLMTLNRWITNESTASDSALNDFYNMLIKKNVMVNEIKEQLYKEELPSRNLVPLFHGSKSGIEDALTLDRSRINNDFGQGFYCGESFRQSASFVSNFSSSSVYAIALHPENLACLKFGLDQDWALTIAAFRGRLQEYEAHPRITQLKSKVAESDYIVAPIADNRMFEIIDSFIEGEITDEQCKHCLSATHLGSQYVIKSQRAIEQTSVLERCFLCTEEREAYTRLQTRESKTARDKSKIARKQYRGLGKYIEELLS